MKFAIVGTGIAGLTTGWLLNRAGHEVVLIERMDQPGLSAHSVDFSLDGSDLVADVPSRLFNSSLWPQLFRLYSEIGVESEIVDPSKTLGEIGAGRVGNIGLRESGSATHLRMKGSYFSSNLYNLWQALLRKPVRQIAADIRRMKTEVSSDLADRSAAKFDFDTYLNQRSYSDAFRNLFLFPSLASTVCTCSYASLRRYPAETILRAMLSLASDEGLVRARHGSRDVASRLIQSLPVRYGTSVRSAVASESGVRIEFEEGAREGNPMDVDHLVVATQANTATRILPGISDQEKQMLNAFEYEPVQVVLHRDERVMPNKRRLWSTFNLATDASRSSAMCTVWMNRFYPDWPIASPVFQTITPIVSIDPEKTLCQRLLQRPTVGRSSLDGWERLADVHRQPGRRIWFCGSYASQGVPLLESGVVSSLNVLRALNLPLPHVFEHDPTRR